MIIEEEWCLVATLLNLEHGLCGMESLRNLVKVNSN